MSTRMFSARVCVASPETLALLWQAHCKWNRAMREHMLLILRALRGELGEGEEERRRWAEIAEFLKTTRIRGKDILSACAYAHYTSRVEHPLATFEEEIYAVRRRIGGTPAQNPDPWMDAIEAHPEWQAALAEKWTPLSPEERQKVQADIDREKKKAKDNALVGAPNKKARSPQDILAAACRQHSPTFVVLDNFFSKEWRAFRLRLGQSVMFDREALTPGWGSAERYRLYDCAVARLRSYWELLEAWHAGHRAWLIRKREFETKNADYLEGYKPLFDAFYRECGQTTARRQRWHRYLEFLKSTPALTGFRGLGDGKTIVLPSGPEYERALAEHRRRNKKIPPTAVEQRFLLKANPALLKLHEIDEEYRDEFLREGCRRRNPDGYGLPPAFTLPDPLAHPAWFEFQNGAGYALYELPTPKGLGRIRLNLPGKRHVDLLFAGGDRLGGFKPLNTPVERNRKTFNWRWRDRQGRDWLAHLQGVKLVFKHVCELRARAESPGAPLLFFTVLLEPTDLSALDQEVTAAVDLGIHIPAAITIMREGLITAVRVIRDKDLEAATKTLPLRDERRRLARSRRKSRLDGPPIEGHGARFQRHINASGDDRVKKLAEKIVTFAASHGAGILLVEDLSGLHARSAELRAINRSITGWLRGRLLDRLEQEAKSLGILLKRQPAYSTSRVCHRCGERGVRYDQREDGPRFSPVGALFVCPSEGCLIDFNADVNASINLHRVYRKQFKTPPGPEWEALRARCEARLRRVPALAEGDLVF